MIVYCFLSFLIMFPFKILGIILKNTVLRWFWSICGTRAFPWEREPLTCARKVECGLICRAVESCYSVFHHWGLPHFVLLSLYLYCHTRDFVPSHLSFSCVFQKVCHQFNSSGKAGIRIQLAFQLLHVLH